MAAELKTKQTAANVDDFIDALKDEEVRDDCRVLVKLMSDATKAPPKMWGPSIIGFGTSKLRYPNGRELDWMELAFSPRKAALTLYLVEDFEKKKELLGKLGKHSASKACLYVKRLSDVDMKVLKALVEGSVKEMRKKTKVAKK